MFVLKKMLSAGLQPGSLLLFAIGAGLLLIRFTKKRRIGQGLLIFGLLGLYMSSITPVANALVRPLENAYPPLLPLASVPVERLLDGSPPPAWIVVLGAGNLTRPDLAPVQQLSSTAVARLGEGLRLHRLFPDAKLLLSGGSEHSHLLAEAALSLGVPRDRMVLAPDVLDTADEAQALHTIVGHQSSALVTSASHMPRAMALCRKAGMNPLAAPTDYASSIQPGFAHKFLDLIPHAQAALLVERALHEMLGLVWAKLRGQV